MRVRSGDAEAELNADNPNFETCLCQVHPSYTEELSDARTHVGQWPGPICGTCWASSCACGYTFDNAADAAARAPLSGRLVCHSCAPTPLVGAREQ